MVLNRKGPDVERDVARFAAVRSMESGPIFARAELEYEVAGTRFVSLELRAYATEPRLDAAVRMLKTARWEPENVYVALPFAPGPGPWELRLDRAGGPVRPRLDQLPGTLTDFSTVQHGMVLATEDYGLAVATPDAPIVQMGPLDHGERRLAGDPDLDNAPEHLYSWAMTNYWETNFEASLGGFHEFRYSLSWGPDLQEPGRAIQRCRNLNEGIFCFRLG